MDIDDQTRLIAAGGTAADFSNWKGIGHGNFKSIAKIVASKEKIIEPDSEETAENTSEEDELMNKPLPPPPQKKEQPKKIENVDLDQAKVHKPKKESKDDGGPDRKQMPGVQEAYLNPAELKSIAIKLMPNADKVPPEKYTEVSEAAINFAFEFLRVWSLKVSVEG